MCLAVPGKILEITEADELFGEGKYDESLAKYEEFKSKSEKEI